MPRRSPERAEGVDRAVARGARGRGESGDARAHGTRARVAREIGLGIAAVAVHRAFRVAGHRLVLAVADHFRPAVVAVAGITRRRRVTRDVRLAIVAERVRFVVLFVFIVLGIVPIVAVTLVAGFGITGERIRRLAVVTVALGGLLVFLVLVVLGEVRRLGVSAVAGEVGRFAVVTVTGGLRSGGVAAI